MHVNRKETRFVTGAIACPFYMIHLIAADMSNVPAGFSGSIEDLMKFIEMKSPFKSLQCRTEEL